METSAQKSRVVRFGLFEADLDRRVLSKSGLKVKLQDQPFRVLALLLDRTNQIVSREEIQQQLWPSDTFVAFDDGLNTAIKKLRLALGDSSENPSFIETIPRRGYRFLGSPIFVESSKELVKKVPPAISSAIGSNLQVDGARESSNMSGAPTKPSLTRRWILGIGAALIAIMAFSVWGFRSSSESVKATPENANVGSSQHKSGTHGSVDPRARDEYLEARNDWKRRTADSLTRAIEHYNAAIERDPNYAEAYAGLANTYVVMPMLTVLPVEDAYRKSREAADKAVTLDDSSAAAQLAQAEVKLYADWNFPGAEREFRRSIELDAGDAQAHQWYAEFLSLMGRHDEAITQIQAAEHLDPAAMIIHHQAGQIFQAARRYDEAFEEYRKALMIQPTFGPTYTEMALAYRRQGRLLECLKVERQSNIYWDPGGTAIADLNRVQHALQTKGRSGYFQAHLEFDQKHSMPAYFLAIDYALVGRNDLAIEFLRKALQGRRPDILSLRNDPEFDGLSSDPRFQEIAKQVGFQTD